MTDTEDDDENSTIMEDFNQKRQKFETTPPSSSSPSQPQQQFLNFDDHDDGDDESFNSSNDDIEEQVRPLGILPPPFSAQSIQGKNAGRMSDEKMAAKTENSYGEERGGGVGPQRRRTVAAAMSPGKGKFEETQYFATSFQPPSPDQTNNNNDDNDDNIKSKETTWEKRLKTSLSSGYYSARNTVRKKVVSFQNHGYTPVSKRETTPHDDVASESVVSQPLAEEDYYQDDYNDYSWKCTFGTNEDDGIWMNTSDQAGTIMAILVWIFIIYSGVTVTLLAKANHFPYALAMAYCTICGLALASHAKTAFTDPGAIPQSAVPSQSCISLGIRCHAMCSQCQTFKPPYSHHCRICNRCISRMDHHCPWMNNCIGAANFKHFILFLVYIWIGSAMALLIFGCNYFFCGDESCTFNAVLIQLVRTMTIMCFGSFLFTSSMIMNVVYSVMTGIGTIDRLKRKAGDTMLQAEDHPIPLKDIFGVGGYYTWPFPIDPIFEDYDLVMGYSTPQRLLREKRISSVSGCSNNNL